MGGLTVAAALQAGGPALAAGPVRAAARMGECGRGADHRRMETDHGRPAASEVGPRCLSAEGGSGSGFARSR
jgi:hypothetical protein